MAIAIVLGVIGVVVDVSLNRVDATVWKDHKLVSILGPVLPPTIYLLGDFIWHLFRSSYDDYRELADKYEREITKLRAYKQAVEQNEVKLELVNCYSTVVHHEFPYGVSEEGIALRASLKNPRGLGLPGKTAKSVAAHIKFLDGKGKRFKIFGRWAASDQPESRSPLVSKVDLLRMSFEPGSEFDLDIAAKFPRDASLVCYAVDNDCFPNVRHNRTALHGSKIVARVELVAEYVHQWFEVSFEDTLAKLQCIEWREIAQQEFNDF